LTLRPFVAGEYLRQIELVYDVVDEVRQVVVGQPLLRRRGKKVTLVCVVRLESFHRHLSRVTKPVLDVF